MAKHDRKQDLLPPSAPLSLSDERLTNLLESIADGFCLLDHDWTIRYINTRGADMLAPQPLAQHMHILCSDGHDEGQAEREAGQKNRGAERREHAKSICTTQCFGY